MQVSDVTMKENYTKDNTYNSMLPIIYFLNMFSLNYNAKPNFKSSFVLLKSICTALTLGAINFFCLYYKINYIYDKLDLSIKSTDCVQIISDYCQYIIDLYFVYKYGRNICVEYFKQYERIDKFLGDLDYSAVKWKIIKITIWFITIWLLSSLGDLGAWMVTYGWIMPAVHSILFLFLLIKMLTTLDLISHVMQIEARLKIVFNIVKNFYSSADVSRSGLVTDCVRNEKWLYHDDDTKINIIKADSKLSAGQEAKRLTECYLLLTEQVAYINKMYGFRVLLNTLSILLDMVKVTNIGIRIAIGTQITLSNSTNFHYLPTISGFLRLLTCASIVISLVHHSERAYAQKNKIVNVIDHFLIRKHPDEELRSAMVELRALIQDRSISFNMANFFTLNYSLLVSITSVVVTYTIILLQNVK